MPTGTLEIEVPYVGIVEFPSDTKQEDIEAILNRTYGPKATPQTPEFKSPIELPPVQPREKSLYEEPTWFDEPTVKLGDFLIKGPHEAKTPVEEGINKTLREGINSLTSPRNLSYMLGSMGVAATGQAARALVSALWTGAMGANAIENAPQLYGRLGEEMAKPPEKRDKELLGELGTQAFIDTGFFAAPAVGLKRVLTETPKITPTTPEVPSAEAIRSDTGQVPKERVELERVQDASGEDIQQPAPGPTVETAQSQVPLTPEQRAVEQARLAKELGRENVPKEVPKAPQGQPLAQKGFSTEYIPTIDIIRWARKAIGDDAIKERANRLIAEGYYESTEIGKARAYEQAARNFLAEAPKPDALEEKAEAPQLSGPGTPAAGQFEFQSNLNTATGIKNAEMNRVLSQLGQPPLQETLGKPDSALWDRVMARIDKDPGWQDALIEDLKERPRPHTDEEVLALDHRLVDYRIEHAKATRDAAAAYDAGMIDNVSDAEVRAQIWSDKIKELSDITKSSGTETGRALRARRLMMNADFSLAALEMNKRQANGWRHLTPEERSEIQRVHDEYLAKTQALEKHLSETQARLVDEEIKRALAESKAAPYAPQVLQMAEKFAVFMDKQGEAALARIKSKLGRVSIGVDPTVLADVSIYGAAKITRGLTNFAKWSAHMQEAVGDWLKPHLQSVWESSQALLTKQLDAFSKETGPVGEKVKKVVRKGAPEDKLGEVQDKLQAKAEKGELDTIFHQVQQLVRLFVEEDPKITREPLIDRVHEVLSQYIPNITRLETMDAISGRGRFSIPKQDAVSKTIRDLKTQTRLVGHQIDVEAKRPLPRTGYQPDKLSDIARHEEQRLNELKRKYGVVVTDPVKQLASVLSSRKTYYRNRLADLAEEIRTRERIVKTKTAPPTDPELESLRSEYATLKKEHEAIFVKPGLTDAQRLALSEKAADRQIAELERQLASGEIFPGEKAPTLMSPKLEAKKARIEALKSERFWARDLLQPKTDPVLKALISRRASLTKTLADLQERIARGDYAPRGKKPTLDISDDPVAMRLMAEVEHTKAEFNRGLAKDRAMRRGPIAKTYAAAKEIINLPRAIWSAFDLSAVGRQGGWIGAGHPIIAARSIVPMFRALASEKSALAIEQGILNDPVAPLAAKSKLYLAALDEFRLTRQEEIMMSRFANAIPGVRHSNRAFMTYLNKLRLDSFKALLKTRESWFDEPVTQGELEAIANYVNIATGRGNLGKAAGFAEGLATVFWSPRLVASRFQLLAGEPMYRGSWRTRALIASEYGRSLTGLAVLIGLGSLIGASLETDPRSADFLKLRFGNTRIDIFGGLIQNTVVLSRFISGKTKPQLGKPKPVKSTELWGNFLRSKLSPTLGMTMDTRDILSGQKPPPGHPQTMTEMAKRSVVPLSWQDILDVMKEQGVPEGVAIEILSLFGAGVQHYQPTTK